MTWVKHICNYLSSVLGIRNVPQLSGGEKSQLGRLENTREHRKQEKNPHMKNSPSLMAQEEALERSKRGNFTAKTLGSEEEAAKKAWIHLPQNRTAINAFKVERVFMVFLKNWVILLCFFFSPAKS